MSKNYITGRLGYNVDNGRYGLLVTDLWEKTGFHCGETLQVEINGEWVDTRMEMESGNTWYLMNTPFHGDLEYIRARIKR